MKEEVPVQIKRARVQMSFDHPFFGYLSLTLAPVAVPDMKPPTMGTDGYHLFYHPDFIKSVSTEVLTGVIAHEIGHIILKHLTRRQTREQVRWNVAADAVDNALILKEFVLPEGIVHLPEFDGKTAEYVYNNLPASKQGAGTLDSHEEWKNWGKRDGEGDKDKDGNSQGDDGMDGGDDLEQQWQQRVAMAATQAKFKGKFPAHLESIVGELLQPKLEWKAILQDTITSCAKNDFRLMPANKKHLYRGFMLPSISGETINIACGVDDSGSIPDEDITTFLSEVKGICDTYDDYTIHLYIADAAIHHYYELHSFDPMPKIVTGRGGTDFRPVIEAAEKLDITSLVYFTDLFGTFPDKEPRIPVIWVATSDQKVPWGMVVRYPEVSRGRRKRY